jgi:hypothetical protein
MSLPIAAAAGRALLAASSAPSTTAPTASTAAEFGLPASTPRIVVERLRPFFLADPDFATSLRLQLDAARAELLPRASSSGASRPTPR